ncbi:hypothetical protein YC2023_030422 [Brassica napus]
MSFLKDKSLSTIPTVNGLKTSWKTTMEVDRYSIAFYLMPSDAVEVEAIRIE